MIPTRLIAISFRRFYSGIRPVTGFFLSNTHTDHQVCRLIHQSLRLRSPLPQLRTMKLETPAFRSIFTPEMELLHKLFQKYNYELRIAGGAVRDLLMGKVPQDIDFATTATPAQMNEMFEKEGIRTLNKNGEKHGTVTCRLNDKENFEVTTLRIDVVTDGRHANVEFTKDWMLDSERRDLTINSMFLGFDGTVYDYFSGQEDLRAQKVRFVGDATKRIQEDFLRILRYFRFYGRVAKDPDAHEKETLDSIRANMHGLAGISGERIWVEVKKILVGNHASDIVRVMMELGMGPYIGLPESPDVVEFTTVWDRCRDLQPMPLTVLPALLKHEEEVYKLHDRLKLSNMELKLGLFIVNHRHDDFGKDEFTYCKDLMCDTAGKEPKVKEKVCELLKYLGKRDLLDQVEAYEMPKLPVTGHKLIAHGIPKGKALGCALDFLRKKWKESGYLCTEEELLEHLEEFKKSK